jgi:hypothetical protein
LEQPGGATADSGFTPIRPNPYIVGNPVRGRAMFFGREAEFEVVRKRFAENPHGGLLVFCGERRSGKTSILFQILDRRLGPDFIPVLVDMQSMAISNVVDFLSKITDEVQRALGPDAGAVERPDYTTGSNPSSVFQRYIASIVRVYPDKKLLLLFDEYELFENKIDSGVLVDDVLHVLANLMENHSVFLIFTGSQHLEARRRDYWKILGKSIYKTISYLEREDALNLVRKPVEGVVRYEDDVVEGIWRLAAGQPFYTQALCQGLVDTLNEKRTRTADRIHLQQVVDGFVNNPLPQMVFLWDGLDRTEKLVLALLAESLADDKAFATEKQLSRTIEQRRYPFDLEGGAIATALEKLFKSEMLLKNDATPPAYAFRMDLWRLWVRRMHSVWQVMREEGLPIRTLRPGRRRLAVILGSAAAALGLAVVLPMLLRGGGGEHGGPGVRRALGRTSMGTLALRTQPPTASIHIDGRPAGTGLYNDTLSAGRNHHVVVRAAGFADSAFALSLEAGGGLDLHVALRRRLGSLRVVTEPPGAMVQVNGTPQGKSPILLRGLNALEEHVVEAALPGRDPARAVATVQPDTVVELSLTLAAGRARIVVTTDPPGAELLVDGTRRGATPLASLDLPLGRHAFQARLAGYVAADTSLEVQATTGQLHVMLRAAPPGILVVQGDRPAQIYVDGILVRENIQNSGPQSVRPGTHQVRVVLLSGDAVEESVEVRSAERVVFDFSTRQIRRSDNP